MISHSVHLGKGLYICDCFSAVNGIMISDSVPLPKALGKCLYVCEFFFFCKRDRDLSHCSFWEVSLCFRVFLCREWDRDLTHCSFGEVSLNLQVFLYCERDHDL